MFMNNSTKIKDWVIYVVLNAMIVFTALFSPKGAMLGTQLLSTIPQWVTTTALVLNYIWWIFGAFLALHTIFIIVVLVRSFNDLETTIKAILDYEYTNGEPLVWKTVYSMVFVVGIMISLLCFNSGFIFYGIVLAAAISANTLLVYRAVEVRTDMERLGITSTGNKIDA